MGKLRIGDTLVSLAGSALSDAFTLSDNGTDSTITWTGGTTRKFMVVQNANMGTNFPSIQPDWIMGQSPITVSGMNVTVIPYGVEQSNFAAPVVTTPASFSPSAPVAGQTVEFVPPVITNIGSGVNDLQITHSYINGTTVTWSTVVPFTVDNVQDGDVLYARWIGKGLDGSTVSSEVEVTVQVAAPTQSAGVQFGAGDYLFSASDTERNDTFIMAFVIEVPPHDVNKMLFSRGPSDIKVRREATLIRVEQGRTLDGASAKVGSAVQTDEKIGFVCVHDGSKLRAAMIDSTGTTTFSEPGPDGGVANAYDYSMRFGQHETELPDADGVIFHSWRMWTNVPAADIPDMTVVGAIDEFIDPTTRDEQPIDALLTAYGDATSTLRVTLDGNIENFTDGQVLGGNLGRTDFTMSGQPVAVSGDTAPADPVDAPEHIWIGAVSEDSVTTSMKVPDATKPVRLVVSTSSDFSTGKVYGGTLTPDPDYSFVRHRLSGLNADTQYYVAAEIDGLITTARTGQFKTAPASGTFSFLMGSCMSTDSNAIIFDTMRTQNTDALFFQHMGDLHYQNIYQDDLSQWHAAIDSSLSQPRFGTLLQSLPTPYIWDDHDYGPNNSDASLAGRDSAVKFFRDRTPNPVMAQSDPLAGVYYTYDVGKVRFAVLDCRSERVTDAIISPDQEAWLIGLGDTLPSDMALCLVSSCPWISSGGSDNWNDASAQRGRIGTALQASVGGRVWIISGDMHALAYDDGTNSVGNIPVCHAAPMDTNSHSSKGGPYSGGITQASLSQYGRIEVADGSGGLTVTFIGYSVDQATGAQTEEFRHQVIEATAAPATNLLDLTQPAYTSATGGFSTTFDPLVLTSLGLDVGANGEDSARGGWSFQSVANEAYVIAWDFTYSTTPASSGLRITTDDGFAGGGNVIEDHIDASGTTTITGTGETIWVGVLLSAPGGETVTVNELSVVADAAEQPGEPDEPVVTTGPLADRLSIQPFRTGDIIEGQPIEYRIEGLSENEYKTFGIYWNMDDDLETGFNPALAILPGLMSNSQMRRYPVGPTAVYTHRTPGTRTIKVNVVPPAWTGITGVQIELAVPVQPLSYLYDAANTWVVVPAGESDPTSIAGNRAVTFEEAWNTARHTLGDGSALILVPGGTELTPTSNSLAPYEKDEAHVYISTYNSGKCQLNFYDTNIRSGVKPDQPRTITLRDVVLDGGWDPVTADGAGSTLIHNYSSRTHYGLTDCVIQNAKVGISFNGQWDGIPYERHSLMICDTQFENTLDYGIYTAKCQHVGLSGVTAIWKKDMPFTKDAKDIYGTNDYGIHGLLRASTAKFITVYNCYSSIDHGWSGGPGFKEEIEIGAGRGGQAVQPHLRIGSSGLFDGSRVHIGRTYIESGAIALDGGASGGNEYPSCMSVNGVYGVGTAARGGTPGFGHSGITVSNSIFVKPNVIGQYTNRDGMFGWGNTGDTEVTPGLQDKPVNLSRNAALYLRSEVGNSVDTLDYLTGESLNAGSSLTTPIPVNIDGPIAYAPNLSIPGALTSGITLTPWGPQSRKIGVFVERIDETIYSNYNYATPPNVAVIGTLDTPASVAPTDDTHAADFWGRLRPATPSEGPIEANPLVGAFGPWVEPDESPSSEAVV